MAILIFGTICPFCEIPINEGQKVIAFSPFVSNELDPLWIFSDRAFHAGCFHRHPLAEKAYARYEEIKNRLERSYRICAICNRKITSPDDYFCVHHLTDNQQHPLYYYNYLQLHCSCIATWSELPNLYKLLQELKHSGAWRGKGLEFLLTQIENLQHNK